MRVLGSIFLAILLLMAIIIVPLASADDANVTLVTTPFMTIDPIGKHTVGDVFFINGTTNLPVSENFTMIIAEEYHSAMKNSPDENFLSVQNNISVNSISSTIPGTNRWSVNVTDITKGLLIDKYYVEVSSIRNNSISAGTGSFSILPAINFTVSTVVQTTIPSPPSIQLTTSAVTVPSTTHSSPLPTTRPSNSTPFPSGTIRHGDLSSSFNPNFTEIL